MSSHPELDQLSAYVDDELADGERAALEAHLPSCAECRTTLDALRSTIADLATLPGTAPSEQDSWALRAAIARARMPAKRWQHAAWAAGAVAAAAIAVVAIVRPGGDNGTALTAKNGNEAAGAGAIAAPPIQYNAGAFNAGSAQRKLLVLSGLVNKDAKVTSAPEALSAGGAGHSPQRAAAPTFDTYNASGDATTDIDRCVRLIQRSTQVLLTPVEYDVGTFEGTAAFLLFFRTPERYELWVVDTTGKCNTLYFAQAG